MTSFDFDPTIGLIVTNDTLSLLNDLDALVSKIKQKLQFFYSEWFLDTTVGVPYFQEIFEKPANDALIVSLINEQIYAEDEVNSIKDVSIDYDIDTRSFSYSANIETEYGTASITSNLTV